MSVEFELHDRLLGCCTDGEIGEFLDAVMVSNGSDNVIAELKAGPAAETKDRRRELITAVRGGQHMELTVKARVYRQKKGQPNRRYLRFATEALGDIAASFKGQPFLVDHNTYELTARKGTILNCELVADTRGMSALDMTFQVVKPDAVIGILDGTLDRFSIGWFPSGAVLCSVHRTDVRGANSCSCWPGDTVEVDGKAQIVEYEFQSAEGKELSAVSVPAVRGTGIEEIRAALSVELALPPKRSKERVMAFPRSTSVLGFEPSEASDERLAVLVEGLRRENQAQAQELGAARAEVGSLRSALSAVTATATRQAVDTLLAAAYTAGKLKWNRDAEGKAIPSPRETRLRSIAARDGVDALTAELAELEVVVPVGERQLSHAIVEPDRAPTGVLSPADNPYLVIAAREMGIPLEQLQANAREFGSGV